MYDLALWAGTEVSFALAMEAYAKGIEASKSMPQGRTMDDYINEIVGAIYQPEGKVAVINIKGALVPGKASFARLYGNIGYDDIKLALMEAVGDKNIESVLLNVNSPGGAVAGVQDVSDFIKSIDKTKPVATYSESIMGSAGMWIGASARYVMSSQSAILGSIGVMMTHKEMSKAMEMQGIKATIIRSGEFKALGGPLEPLSDTAKAQMQEQVNYLAGLFDNHIAQSRNMTVSKVQATISKGREFIGQQAVDVGLTDLVTTFAGAHAKTAELAVTVSPNPRKPVAGAGKPAHNSANFSQGHTMNFTAEQLAMLASGTPLKDLGLSAEDLASAEAAVAAQVTAQKAAKAEADAKAALAAAANPVADQSGFLRTELKATQLELATITAAATAKDAALAEAKAISETFLTAARSSLGAMQIAMNMADTSAAMSAKDVSAEHAKLSKLFAEKYPTGRVTAVVAKQVSQEFVLDPLLAARFEHAKTQF